MQKLKGLENATLRWRYRASAPALVDARLLGDGPVPTKSWSLAIVRSIVRANPRLAPVDALVFASETVAAAERHHIDPGFLGATLLQESSYNPDAVSAAGAVGIAQFTLDTADGAGVDPFDWRSGVEGAASLLGQYVNAYRGVYPDPYAAALAAYNAGPGAVEYYKGVPPYAETKEYVSLIYDRWSRLVRDLTGVGAPRP